MISETNPPAFTLRYVNLASASLGARATTASDEFFAAKERMLRDSEPVFHADEYDANGKWMDGWETRRRRHGGHDHCIVRLADAGQIHGVEVDTSYFTGNYPPDFSLDGAFCGDREPNAGPAHSTNTSFGRGSAAIQSKSRTPSGSAPNCGPEPRRKSAT